MKVANPNNTAHDFTFIPRFYTEDSLFLVLYNEATKETSTVSNTYILTDGNVTISYSFDFSNNSKYQIKITDSSDNVVYRGKLIATSQNTQDYKLTDSLYIYEAE